MKNYPSKQRQLKLEKLDIEVSKLIKPLKPLKPIQTHTNIQSIQIYPQFYFEQ